MRLTLMTEYQPYGVRHFLRKLDPRGLRTPLPSRDPSQRRDSSTRASPPTSTTFQLDGILVYRTLVPQDVPRSKADRRLLYRAGLERQVVRGLAATRAASRAASSSTCRSAPTSSPRPCQSSRCAAPCTACREHWFPGRRRASPGSRRRSLQGVPSAELGARPSRASLTPVGAGTVQGVRPGSRRPVATGSGLAGPSATASIFSSTGTAWPRHATS